MPALYPSMVPPEAFKPGDCVRKFVTEWNVTPFVGIVTHIVPATYKVWVQWPVEHTAESPETLIRVNPQIFGLPSVIKDMGYSSYEKELSQKNFGVGLRPREATGQEKMAIRVAHTFATETVGKLVDSIVSFQEDGLSDVQTYGKIYEKFGSVCSDYIIKSSIKKVYAELTEKVADDALVNKVFEDELKSPIDNRMDKELKELQKTVGREILKWVEDRIEQQQVERHLEGLDPEKMSAVKKALRNKAMMYITKFLSVK